MVNKGRMGKVVNRESTKATGMDRIQMDPLSNKKVSMVFPPERIVKYEAWRKACKGMNTAVIRIRSRARSRTSSVVL